MSNARKINDERSWIEINLSNFEDNLTEIKKFLSPHQEFLQIVKADAYGHGAYQIAKKAVENGASMLGVANVDEALLIRYHDLTTPVLILSPSLESEIENIVKNDLIPTVNDIFFANKLNQIAQENNKEVKVHVNIDTGMNRSGVRADQALEFIQELSKLANLKIDGLFTHFAESENISDFTNKQYSLFCSTLDKVISKIIDFEPRYLHASNSCAVVNYNFSRMNLVRIGILSFGIYPNPLLKNRVSLKAVMKFVTKISQIKFAKKDEYIGYNLTYQAKKDITYAVLPIGYADGYNYLLKNKGKVFVRKRLMPIIGKVTMDMIMIDITDIDNPSLGEEVILFGIDKLSIEDLSSLYAGSPYELATQTGKRAKRFYYYKNTEIAREPRLRREFYSPDFSAHKLSSIIQNALSSRIKTSELSQVLFSEIIDNLISESDKNISYKTDFKHKVKFSESSLHPDFYLVTTELIYRKILNADNFLIACTSNEETLDRYFKNPRVEYRWLLASQLELTSESFLISEVTVNGISAEISASNKKDVLEFTCSNKGYSRFIGQRCSYSIKTKTLYPKKSHQLSIFISEATKGLKIIFEYPASIEEIDTVTFFSGETKYPSIKKTKKAISVESEKGSWILANSGVVFSY